MGKWLKWAMILFGGFALLLVLAVFLIPSFVDIQTYKPAIEEQASQALGLPVHLDGDMELSVFPWVGVSLSNISADNPPGFTHEKLLTVESFDVRVKLLPLLSKDIRVKRFVLQKPSIFLEKNASGRGNWEVLGEKAKKETPSKSETGTPSEDLPIKALAIDDFSVSDGSLQWIDSAAGVRKEISELNLQVTNVSLDNPVPISFSAKLDGKPVSLEGEIGPLGKQPGKGTIPFDIAVSALSEIKTHLKGEIQDPIAAPRIEMDLRIDSFSPRKAMTALDLPFPSNSIGPKALEKIAFNGHISGTPEKAALSDGVLELDETRANLSLTATDFAKPDITFDIALDRLDANRYLPPAGSGKSPSEAPEPVESAPLESAPADLEPLQKISIDGALRIGTLALPEAELSKLEFHIKGDKGVFDLRFNAETDGKPVSLTSRIGPVKTDAVPVEIALSVLGEMNIRLKGKVRNPMERPLADISLQVEPFSPRKILASLNRPFPVRTSDPEVLNRLAFQGDITADPASLSISDGKLQLDQSSMGFSAAVKNPKAPDIRFDVNLDALDLDRYLPPPTDQPSAAEKPEAEKPTQPQKVDFKLLRQMRVDGQARIGKLKASNADIQDMRLKIFGEKGIFRLDPLTLNLYRGNIAVKSMTDVRPEVPASELDLKMEGVQAGPLLRDVMNKDVLEGTTQAELSLKMKGIDADQIKRTLGGKGFFLFKDGAVKGINLTAMVRNVDTAFTILGLKEGGSAPSGDSGENQSRTDFSELNIRFEIVNGLVKVPEATLTSPFIRANVSGDADLVRESLDFRVVPKFVSTAKGQGDTGERAGYMVPVVVGGDFSSPTFRPDVKAMIQMVPKETINEILADPKKGVDKLIDQEKGKLKDFLNIGNKKKETKPSERSQDTAQPQPETSDREKDKKTESVEKSVGDILKKLPFGN